MLICNNRAAAPRVGHPERAPRAPQGLHAADAAPAQEAEDNP